MTYPSIRRVVITGLGVVAPNGIGKQAFWEACVAGRSGIRPITQFDASRLPTRIAGEAPDFDPAAFGLTCEECSHLDRNTQFALAAAQLALADAGFTSVLTEDARDQMGVFMGTAMASSEEAEKVWLRLTNDGVQPLHQREDVAMSDALLVIHSPAAAVA